MPRRSTSTCITSSIFRSAVPLCYQTGKIMHWLRQRSEWQRQRSAVLRADASHFANLEQPLQQRITVNQLSCGVMRAVFACSLSLEHGSFWVTSVSAARVQQTSLQRIVGEFCQHSSSYQADQLASMSASTGLLCLLTGVHNSCSARCSVHYNHNTGCSCNHLTVVPKQHLDHTTQVLISSGHRLSAADIPGPSYRSSQHSHPRAAKAPMLHPPRQAFRTHQVASLCQI